MVYSRHFKRQHFTKSDQIILLWDLWYLIFDLSPGHAALHKGWQVPQPSSRSVQTSGTGTCTACDWAPPKGTRAQLGFLGGARVCVVAQLQHLPGCRGAVWERPCLGHGSSSTPVPHASTMRPSCPCAHLSVEQMAQFLIFLLTI